MPPALSTELIPDIAPAVGELLTSWAVGLPDLRHADVRLEVKEGKFAVAEDGTARSSGDDRTAAFGIRVLGGARMVAPGYFGREVGIADVPRLLALLREGLGAALRRARASAELKAQVREKFPGLGEALADTRLCPVAPRQDVVAARFAIDPRAVALDTMVSETEAVSRELAALDARLAYSYVSTMTELRRELFASSDGALIDQSFALTQGACYVVATGEGNSQELYDVVGHQRGWEILAGGVAEPPVDLPPFAPFALALGREAVELAGAPVLPTLDREVTVVTDPHYNTLLSHEIIGHPVELDRALKMETAYAGRSWLFRDMADHQVGKQVASPLITAVSDPTLPGYGHYAYDHEGTPARRVVHIDRGVFTGFMNSRQTAAIFGGAPNGHCTSTAARLVPLVRMSSTVFEAGTRDPRDIIAEVDHGYYLVGHRTPSIAESRESFRISARKVYEIRDGRLGRLYRDGGITAESRDFLMAVDAVGTDFRLYPIPNCGKGQPMQTRKLGNGGPTMRSRAFLAGGS